MGGRHNPAVRADNCSPTAEIEERMSERDEGRDGPRGGLGSLATHANSTRGRPAAPRTSSTRPAATTYIRHVPGVRRGCQDCADLQTRIPLPGRQFILEVGTITRSAQSALCRRRHNAEYVAGVFVSVVRCGCCYVCTSGGREVSGSSPARSTEVHPLPPPSC